jgi:hypothetical protein
MMKKTLAICMSLMMVFSCLVLAAPAVSAYETPKLYAVDSNSHTYESTDSNPLYIYKNYSTGVTPLITNSTRCTRGSCAG